MANSRPRHGLVLALHHIIMKVIQCLQTFHILMYLEQLSEACLKHIFLTLIAALDTFIFHLLIIFSKDEATGGKSENSTIINLSPSW